MTRAFATTPLRDLVRGRLSGRLDLDRAVEDAGLPEPAAGLVRQVARRTRLTRLERADVARELASHFREGLDAGRNADDLIRGFGDPVAAARLIRRGKKRARGPLHKAWTRGWQVIGATTFLLIAAYSVQAVRFHVGSPRVAIDYLAQLNQRAASVPAGMRAWPVYERAIAAFVEPPMVEPPAEEGPGLDPPVVDPPAQLKVNTIDPGEANWPAVVDHIRANEATLALIRRAAEFEEMGLTPRLLDSEPGDAAWGMEAGWLLDVAQPHLGPLKQLAVLLAADARLAVEEGDGERVVANLAALVRMAEHARTPAMLINQLFGLSMLDLAVEHAVYVLDARPGLLADAQWSRVAHALAGCCDGGRVGLEFGPERLIFYDLLQRTYTDDGGGGGRLTLDGLRALDSMGVAVDQELDVPLSVRLAGPILAVAMAGRAEMRREYDRLLDVAERYARQAPWARDHRAFEEAIDGRLGSLRHGVRYLFISFMMPAYARAIDRTAEGGMSRDAALVGVALELHRRRHGGYPEALGALTPDLLPAVPRDIFDGEPMRYARRGGAYVLYSIGGDGDDDGGTPAVDRHGDRDPRVRREGNPVDGDWVLFPPEPR